MGAFRVFLLFIVLAVALLCIRTILIVPKAIDATDCKPSDFDYIPVDNGPLQRFCKAITFPTVSRSYTDLNESALEDLQKFIKTSMYLLDIIAVDFFRRCLHMLAAVTSLRDTRY